MQARFNPRRELWSTYTTGRDLGGRAGHFPRRCCVSWRCGGHQGVEHVSGFGDAKGQPEGHTRTTTHTPHTKCPLITPAFHTPTATLLSRNTALTTRPTGPTSCCTPHGSHCTSRTGWPSRGPWCPTQPRLKREGGGWQWPDKKEEEDKKQQQQKTLARTVHTRQQPPPCIHMSLHTTHPAPQVTGQPPRPMPRPSLETRSFEVYGMCSSGTTQRECLSRLPLC